MLLKRRNVGRGASVTMIPPVEPFTPMSNTHRKVALKESEQSTPKEGYNFWAQEAHIDSDLVDIPSTREDQFRVLIKLILQPAGRNNLDTQR